MAVTDLRGQNALHHLLESEDDSKLNVRPPRIRASLLYLLKHHPPLLHQRDRTGRYPLHTALRRVQLYPDVQRRKEHLPKLAWRLKNTHDLGCDPLELSAWERELNDLELLPEDMLKGGADPHVHDGRGNNALHYVADEDADQKSACRTVYRLQLFIDLGVSISVRNHDGLTPLGVYLKRVEELRAFQATGAVKEAILDADSHQVILKLLSSQD